MISAGYDPETAWESTRNAFAEFSGGKDHLTLSDYIEYLAGGVVINVGQWAAARGLDLRVPATGGRRGSVDHVALPVLSPRVGHV